MAFFGLFKGEDDATFVTATYKAFEDFNIQEYADNSFRAVSEWKVEAGDILKITHQEEGYMTKIMLRGNRLGKIGFDMSLGDIISHCERIK